MTLSNTLWLYGVAVVDNEDSDEMPDAEAPPEESERRFAVNLRMLREREGVSQVKLAQEMAGRGWPWRQQTVTRVESGQRMVRLGEALAIAGILRVSLDQLTAGSAESDAMEKVLSAASGVDNGARYVSGFVRALLAAHETARAVLAETEAMQWPRVRALREVLAERVAAHTLDAAIAEGVRRFEEKEDPSAWMDSRRDRPDARR